MTCFQSNLQREPTHVLIKERCMYAMAIDIAFLMVVLLVVLTILRQCVIVGASFATDVRVSY